MAKEKVKRKKEDVDKLKKLAFVINALVESGEAIMKDGKLGIEDIAELPKLVQNVSDLVDVIKSLEEVKAELKDIDTAEAIEVVKALLG